MARTRSNFETRLPEPCSAKSATYTSPADGPDELSTATNITALGRPGSSPVLSKPPGAELATPGCRHSTTPAFTLLPRSKHSPCRKPSFLRAVHILTEHQHELALRSELLHTMIQRIRHIHIPRRIIHRDRPSFARQRIRVRDRPFGHRAIQSTFRAAKATLEHTLPGGQGRGGGCHQSSNPKC